MIMKTTKKKASANSADSKQYAPDWTCKCGFSNWDRRAKCLKCGEPKRTTKGPVGPSSSSKFCTKCKDAGFGLVMHFCGVWDSAHIFGGNDALLKGISGKRSGAALKWLIW